MARLFTLLPVAVLGLVVACGGSDQTSDPGPGDVVDPGPPDTITVDVPVQDVAEEVRDNAGEDQGSDPGPCECGKAEDCEPLFPDLGQCEKAYCDAATCQCVSGNAVDGTACSDGEDCTDGDACKAGECVPGLNLCDCQVDDDCLAYEDGNPCNGTLFCDTGLMPTVCNVDPLTVVVCTDDLDLPCKTKECIPETGVCAVINLDEGETCNDGNECTENDICTAGECEGEHTVTCDDGIPCTMDACVFGKGCVFSPIDCDDGDSCTVDSCDSVTGECVHASVITDDGDPCTEQSCDPLTGVSTHPVDCDDGNDCTLDPPCNPLAGCVHPPNDTEPACRLLVEFDAPERAVNVEGDGVLTVTGHVVSPAGPITDFKVWHDGWLDPQPDSTDIPGEDGSFSLVVTSVQGLNLLQAEVVDSLGRMDRAVRSYYYSTLWNEPQSLVPDGLMGFLGPEGWDDDDESDLDDMAALLSLLAKNFDPMSFLTNPVTTQSFGGCEFQLNVLGVTFDDVSVDFVPQGGGLVISLLLSGVEAPIHVPTTGSGCTDVDGTLVASSINLSSVLNVSVFAGGEPLVSVVDTDVVIEGMALEPDCAPYCGLIEPIRLLMQAMVIVEINERVPGMVENALKTTLEQSFDTSVLVPGGGPAVNLTFEASFSTVDFSDAGAVIGVNAGFKGFDSASFPQPGSIGRAQCLALDGDLTFPYAGPVEVALHDDLLNQISFTLHHSGAWKYSIDEQQIQEYGVDLTSIGITDVSLEIETLQPLVATSCNPAGDLEGQMGDVKVIADMNVNGSPVKALFFISLASAAEWNVMSTQGGTEISASPQSPHVAVYDLEILEGDPGMAAYEFEQFLDGNLLPQLKDVLAGLVETHVVPPIDLNYYLTTYLQEYMPSYFPTLPPGSTLDLAVEDLLRAFGYSVFSGSGN